ncbi:MAG: amidohydrolase family protein, partial [Nanoarchaeota archaeon]
MIIDGHAHFINREIAKEIVKDNKRFDDLSVDEGKKLWLGAMDKNGVEKTVFMGVSSGNKIFTEFINSSDRFIGISNVNPIEKNAVKKLDKDIKDGYKGLKLYPTARAFDVSDERAYKVYDYCEKKKLPIVIHFGV